MTDTWYRCEHPEQPTDALVRWHYRSLIGGVCPGCAFGAHIQRRLHPDVPHVAWLCDQVIGKDDAHLI